jgi:diadenosine tetraphosphatase ApaH/serine/threonine PP2A family protein phosphatase
MKLALLADVHSNLEALTACLDHAAEQGAERHAFVGDLVGYGADPVAVLEIVESHLERGAIVVQGNHDAATVDGNTTDMNQAAAEAIEWTRNQVSQRHREMLSGLPLLLRAEAAVFVHGSAAAPEKWTYVSDPMRAANSLQAAASSYVFCGHVHEPVLYYTGASARPVSFRPVPEKPIPVSPHRRWLAVVGSVGQPRDGKTAACYAMFDTGKSALTFYRVPYDWAAAARKIRSAGLPERLAHRLERGE